MTRIGRIDIGKERRDKLLLPTLCVKTGTWAQSASVAFRRGASEREKSGSHALRGSLFPALRALSGYVMIGRRASLQTFLRRA